MLEMRTFVINLDRCVERMPRIREQFERQGIAFERFPAVDGRRLPMTDDRPVILYANRRITNSERGCLLSHKAIWGLVANGPDPFAAIFEDDIHISGRLGAFLREVERFDGLEDFADLIKFETTGDLVTLSPRPTSGLPGFPLHDLLSTHYGTAGYLISRRGAKILSAAAESKVMLADHIFIAEEFRSLGLKVLQAVPGLVMQDQYGYREGLEFLGFDRTVEQDPSSRLRSRDLSMPALLSREVRRFGLKLTALLSAVMPDTLKGRKMTMRVPFDKANLKPEDGAAVASDAAVSAGDFPGRHQKELTD